MIAAGKFGTGVAIRQIERWRFRLLEPLTFNDPVHGLLQVPEAFESDLASVRALRKICRWAAIVAVLAGLLLVAAPWVAGLSWAIAIIALALYGLVVGYGMRAAILHDWLYTEARLPRNQCDAIYWLAPRTGAGIAYWRAGIFWVGVRLGGRLNYGSI